MKICVYGASSTLIDKSYIESGEALGKLMAQKGHSLIYGAGGSGMMGAVARGVYSRGGHIIGVVPDFLKVDGILFEHCDEIIYTETMRERKKIMDDNAEAFIVTPGGVGTLDEFFEMLTLKQLNRHNKPIALLNTNGCYNCLDMMIKDGIARKMIGEKSLRLYKLCDTPEEVLDYVETYSEEMMDITELKHIAK